MVISVHVGSFVFGLVCGFVLFFALAAFAAAVNGDGK